jgi:O-antigen ligase
MTQLPFQQKLDRLISHRDKVLYLTVFSLPMFMRLNNWALGVFLALGLLNLFLGKQKLTNKALLQAWPVLVFLLLAVLGAFYGATFSEGLKLMEKFWSLLLIPLIFLTDKDYYSRRIPKVFQSLMWGSVVTVLLCYLNVVYEMISRSEPMSYFFRWRHLGHQFTEIADTHPTYLGLFCVTSIFFLLKTKPLTSKIRYGLVIFLLVGLFQLASRMALFLVLFFWILMVIENAKNQKKALALLVLTIVGSMVVLNTFGSEYIKYRLFTTDSLMEDRRFKRWQASYEIFKENPFMGVGSKNVESIRHDKYVDYGFEVAARDDLNAHNQFLEYLSRNGAIGGFVYVLTIGYLFFLSIAQSDRLFTFLFLAFILANLTESMMVRIKGIEYYALFASLFLCAIHGKYSLKEIWKEPSELIYNDYLRRV